MIKELGLFATHYCSSMNIWNLEGSGMYLTSSVMKIAPNTGVLFIGNSGNGGAIALIAFSVIVLGDNSSLFLENNTAVRCGGAIYSYSIDKHDYLSSRSCFIQNNSTVASLYRNVTVYFLNNTVEQQKINSSTTHYCGHSIYTMSLKPCLYACKQHAEQRIPMEDVLTSVGNFTFNDGNKRDYEMSTSGALFVYTSINTTFSMVPSKETILPVYVSDDLNQTVKADYHLTILNEGNSLIKLMKLILISQKVGLSFMAILKIQLPFYFQKQNFVDLQLSLNFTWKNAHQNMS